MSTSQNPPNPEEKQDKDNTLTQGGKEEEEEEDEEKKEEDESESESESESSSDSDESTDSEIDPNDNSKEANIKRFMKVLNSKRLKRKEEEEENEITPHEDLFDFPEDPEMWRERDLKELWADAPIEMTKPGWDPNWVDSEEEETVAELIAAGRDPPIAPFYLPYRKPYPVIPTNHHDISSPKSVIEELDRIEEFLTWVSFIFPDGSSYEGTVWDDLAHGKGVYVAEQGLVRYEGEWLQNNMEGHGVVEVDIPNIEPVPGSKLEAKMRAQGKIIKRDFMSPEDREWLEKDIEDSLNLTQGIYETPFYENDEWIRQFGRKPEKGRYRYAGQWKHARMHGCGVYEVNERTIYGRFYFGELLEDPDGCDVNVSALHAGIAEVAAAKARMFVNKPDGMVREERGPYSDPQHPYFYEEDDVWMAPGFINQFYEVPDYWKTYVHEVDQEREMWLNSFYRAPLRLPMPAELEYWWAKDETPEFLLINKEPEPDPEDPTKLIYTEDPLILHTPTGRIINYVDDEEHGVRLFWQPPLKEGEDVDPEKVQFLPLGFDEFYGGEVDVQKDNALDRVVTSIENACQAMSDKVKKWAEEKNRAREAQIEILKKEYELKEAELSLEEAIEEMDELLKRMQEEEEKKLKLGFREEEGNLPSEPTKQVKETPAKDEEEEEEEEEEEDEDADEAPSSFGSGGDGLKNNDEKGSKNGKSPFAASSLSFAACGLILSVPSKLQQSFSMWKQTKQRSLEPPSSTSSCCSNQLPSEGATSCSVSFPTVIPKTWSLRAAGQIHRQCNYITRSRLRNRSKQKAPLEVQRGLEDQNFNILSLHIPLPTF